VTLGAQGPHCANSSSKALPSLRSRVSKPSGAEVWGTSGEIGYSVDGSHAELIAVPVASLRRKPKRLSFEQAAAIGVTYLAA
jgi:NADPH:quinone reductase-like Zn-dependent oxidoreductase